MAGAHPCEGAEQLGVGLHPFEAHTHPGTGVLVGEGRRHIGDEALDVMGQHQPGQLGESGHRRVLLDDHLDAFVMG